MIKKIKRIITNPRKYFSLKHIYDSLILGRLFNKWMNLSKYIKSDKLFLKGFYYFGMKQSLDFKNPKNYTQKIQVLKLLNNNKDYGILVDKFRVRKTIKEKIGEDYLIPLLGVWDSFDNIDFDGLPEQFVLKTTHDSGNVFICTDKEKFDKSYAKKKLTHALKANYFYKSREYPYKYAEPRIIAEKYMHDECQIELNDYKFFCFDGSPELFQIVNNKGVSSSKTYYDSDLNEIPLFGVKHGGNIKIYSSIINKMFKIAKKLSAGLKHIRIDLYYINERIYFGEYTFHHSGGIIKDIDPEWNKKIGRFIEFSNNDRGIK
jgi:hypothetical protein